MLPYTYFVFYLGIPDHRDMDSFASGGGPGHRFSMQDDDEEDDEATAMAMANRQSVIKFNVREEEEDDLEREVSLWLIKISDLCFLSLLLHLICEDWNVCFAYYRILFLLLLKGGFEFHQGSPTSIDGFDLDRKLGF